MRAAGLPAGLFLLLLVLGTAHACEDCPANTSEPQTYPEDSDDSHPFPFKLTNKPEATVGPRLLVRLPENLDPVVKLAKQRTVTAQSTDASQASSSPSAAELQQVLAQRLPGAGNWMSSSSHPDLMPTQMLPPAPSRTASAQVTAQSTDGSTADANAAAAAQIRRWTYITTNRVMIVEAHDDDGLDVLQQYFADAQAQGNVEYLSKDKTVKLKPASAPNDAYFSREWAPAKIALVNDGKRAGAGAWATETGDSNIVVAVIDSGAWYRHPDLADNIWLNPDEDFNSQDDDSNGYADDLIGWDFVSDDNDPLDDNGHGTHCAGIIGAVGNNGIGVSGVSQRVSIMILKFMNSAGEGSYSNIQRALEYAIVKGAHITSNSYGADQFDVVLQDMIRAAARQGQLFVTAAGNDKRNLDTTPSYPSSFSVNIILSVAATDINDELASFSNYGPNTVDIGAPGVSILSTWPSDRGITTSGNYREVSGTSMACPMVAGAAALLLAAMRERGMAYERQGLFVKQVLMDSADPIPALSGKIVTGARLNVERAMLQLLGQPFPPAPPPSPPAPPPTPPVPPGSPGGTVMIRTPPNPPGSYPDEPGATPPPPFRNVVPGSAPPAVAQSLLLAFLGVAALLCVLM